VMLQDNKLKIGWDVSIMLVLLIVTVIIPYRLAFVIGDDDLEWKILYTFFDVMFALDIVFCFLTSYTDKFNKLEVTDIKLIAKRYMRGWFWIDLLSVIPFEAIFTLVEDETPDSGMFRYAKLSKMSKIIRLLRLFKILKIIKANKRLVQYFSEKMRISNGTERLIYF